MKQEIKERVEKIRKGEVPEGYRETKVGIIPEEWCVIEIGKMFEFKNGLNKEKSFFGYGKKIVNFTDVYNNRGINVKDLKGLVNVNTSELERYKVDKGDVFFTRTSETIQDIGMSSVILEAEEEAVFSGFVLRARPKNDMLSLNFKKYCFSTNKARKEITIKSSYTTRALTSGTLLNKVLIAIPLESEEQQKIAEILSTWDKAIELKEKQISHSNEYKKGFMQKLLFKRETINTSWTETKLRKCLIPTSYPVNKPSEPYYALGIRSHCKGTLVRYIKDPKKIAMDTLYEVKENELIVNITFAWEGAITLLSKKDEGKLVSHRFPTYKFNEEYAILDYFKQLIKTKWFVFQLGLLSPGGAGRNRVLSKTDFLKLKVLLPPVEEQRKIAVFLNSLDDEINLLNDELNQFKEQKRGLMQLLLTGIVRVKVN